MEIPKIPNIEMSKNIIINKNEQYLSIDEITQKIPFIDIKPTDLGSTDNYNETKILEEYLKRTNENKLLLYKAALQLSIIGYGNKNYGFVRTENEKVITLEEIFKQNNIKFLEKQNAKYSDSDLSARRLIRLFRYQIQKFITDNNRPSYLWTKYADKRNTKLMNICFPGGEHLVSTIEEAEFMLDTYGNLDISLNTKFRKRLQRVFIARGIMSPNYFLEKNY